MALSIMGYNDSIHSALTTATRTVADENDLTEDTKPAVPSMSLIFSKLPREIRDEIYRHAYDSDADDGTFKMVSNT